MSYSFIIKNKFGVKYSEHRKYKKLISKILFEFYSDKILLNGFLYVCKQSFDKKESHFSIINKSVGNITVILWIVNQFNINTFNELIEFVSNNKHNIFKTGGIYFDNLLAILKISERKGIKNEKKAIKILSNYLNGKNIDFKIKQTPLYSNEDVILGIDIILSINNKDWYVQVKPLKNFKVKNGYYKIVSSGKIKKYNNIHYYIFIKDKEHLLFSNTNLKIKNGIIYVPEKDIKL